MFAQTKKKVYAKEGEIAPKQEKLKHYSKNNDKKTTKTMKIVSGKK